MTDLLAQAEMMADIVRSYPDQEWTTQLLTVIEPLLDQTDRDCSESVKAGDDHQKALEQRRLTREAFNQTPIQFRRTIRSVYGSTSREYRALVSRIRDGETEETLPKEIAQTPA